MGTIANVVCFNRLEACAGRNTSMRSAPLRSFFTSTTSQIPFIAFSMTNGERPESAFSRVVDSITKNRGHASVAHRSVMFVLCSVDGLDSFDDVSGRLPVVFNGVFSSEECCMY